MMRPKPPSPLVVAGMLLCFSPLVGVTAAWIAYLVMAAIAAVACLHHDRSSAFYAFGLACVSFAVARTIGTWTAGETLPEAVADFAAYGLLAFGSARLFRRRIRRIEPETFLEIVGLLCLLSLGATAALVLDLRGTSWTTWMVLASAVSGSVVVAALMGRSSHPVMRYLMVAALVAVGAEVVAWNVPVKSLTIALAGLPYIPLAISARSTVELRTEHVSVRRTFGTRQLAALAATMVLPTLVLLQLARTDNLAAAPAVVAAGIVGSVAMALRVLLVVRLRDWSYEREQDIGAFGEQLVVARSTDEVVAATVGTLDRLTEGRGVVGVVDLEEDDGRVLSSVGLQLRRRRRRFRPAPKAHLYGTRDRDDLPSSLRFARGALSLIATDVPGPHRYLLFGAADVLFRPELEEMFKEVANQVAIVLEATSLREEMHKERANRQFKAMAQDSNDLILVVDPETLTSTFVGPTIDRLLGYAEFDYLDRPALQHLSPDDLAVAERTLHTAVGRRSAAHCDVRVEKADGTYNWFRMSARRLEPESEVQGLLVSFINIHDRKMAEVLVRRAESRYRALVQKSTDIFVLVTPELTIDYISPNVEQIIGYRSQDLLGALVTGVLAEDSAQLLERLFADSIDALDGSVVELEVRTGSADPMLAEVTLSDPQLADHEGLLLIIRDITARRHLEESLRNRAIHDQLTGLFNRSSFEHELQGALQRLASDSLVGVINLDLADFKEVNDSVGFAVGNQLLIEVGTRLRSALRDEDVLARLVADEFAVLATGRDEAGLVQFADRLAALFDEPFYVDGKPRRLGVAVGMVTTGDRRKDARKLLQAATVAVHQAKKGETNEVVVYEQSLQDQVDERFELITDMRSAIDNDEFSVVFQPLISLETQEVHSFEALLRWSHPTRGNISPATFIPLAEKSGMIVDLGRWVLDRSCRQLVEWQRSFDGFGNVSMGINLSARQLERHGELDVMLAIIADSGVDASALTFELTESIMLKDASWIRAQLHELRGLGIDIAIDDFGTGASGLNHLRELPFDTVKIDKSYIDRVGVDPDGENLVSQIIDLAKGLDAKTVAEGIETPIQADVLARMGCDIGQGFYLAKPMDRSRIEPWMQERRRAALPGRTI